MAIDYDLVVLGGGTGGYVTAIRASQQGFKTAIVEAEKLGGTCLHKGCIPTKSFLKSAEVFQEIRHANEFGVMVGEPTLDLNQVLNRKDQVVRTLYQGVKHLVNQGKIDVYHGYGSILGSSIFSPMAGSVSVTYDGEQENDILIPKQLVIATGSSAKTIPGMEPDGKKILTSDHALELDELPQSILIVGGGAIGVEWASFYQDVGVNVTLIEQNDQLLPGVDSDIAVEMKKRLKNKGVNIYTDSTVLPETLQIQDQCMIEVNTGNENIVSLSSDVILLSVGRKANTMKIGLENTDVQLDDQGFIQVDQNMQTKEGHIYAIGDVIGGKQLAHAATYEARVAMEHMSGQQPTYLSDMDIPTCIYSEPEVASIGVTESEAKAQGYSVDVTKTSLQAIGKAHVNGDAKGFAKMIVDKETNDVLGIHLIGKGVTELIGQASMARYFDGSALELSEVIYPHPSLSELLGEAALAAEGRNIHG
ncbi:dihydrolipoamide dehydrogenase [Gracilibacillus halophilus YIM-C55.5]|uniref:Dihydrolipoyl dehydrogenase n=1 Tax=Gracilibacillus halophilus YIM-C55.5 TaxID=1308866 RepID=N4WDT6_9BACI|nr:dihydrolipoyl dehydrogenase [Gracilibacillus halophilus]ENH97414.1 dihydrolipoamide dehydrogenase [Gracilibacillus halophilus YIM-C55.5]